jgi:hypothetical protein
MTTLPICSKCKKPGERYGPTHSWCKECFKAYTRIRLREKRAIDQKPFQERGRKAREKLKLDPEKALARAEYHREYRRKYYAANKHKYKAHLAIQKALRLGILERQPCEHCGDPESFAHHPDYDKHLDVVWLCKSCHQLTHSGMLNVTKPKSPVDQSKRLSLVLKYI